jgi:hypothetical protein
MWSTDPSNPTFDIVVRPPWGPNCTSKEQCPANTCPLAIDCPTAMRHNYAYDDQSYNWRELRVLNQSDNFAFVQYDQRYMFGVGPPPTPPLPPIAPAEVMPGVDIVGTDDPSPCPSAPSANNWAACQATCAAMPGCLGWTLHVNGPASPVPGWRCCTKTRIVKLEHAPNTTTSGIMHPHSFVAASIANDASIAIRRSDATADGAPTGQAQHEKGTPPAGQVQFSEFYDINADPYQLRNLWSTLSLTKQTALEAEITRRFACAGTRTTPSTCE